MSSSTVINIPTDEKVFERNCVPLFAGLINDPNVKLVGSRGKKQFGLDLIGKRDRDPAQPVGIQCKLITRGGKLSEATVRSEVSQALSIRPPLTEFYIVTTATDEPALDFLAIELSQQQAAAGRQIDIQVWGWDTLQDKIRVDPRALAAFDPDYSASTNRLIELGTETVEGQSRLLAQGELVLRRVEEISVGLSSGPIDTARSEFEQHLDAQVDQYRDLMSAGKPRTALDLLEKLEATLNDASSLAIRARVKANIAFAKLRLGDETAAADLLAQAFELNPSDPKVRANNILALALRGDIAGAWTFAQQVLSDDPENIGAAGLAFQVASMSSDDLEPFAIVPPELLDDLTVRIHQISYLRQKGTEGSWWELAADTLQRFPEERSAIRMAGEALLDAGISDRAMVLNGSLPDDRRLKVEEAAKLLQCHWDEVRQYENATESIWITVACNLMTAYRALHDLERAHIVSEQMLALGSSNPEASLVAGLLAIDRDEFGEAVRLLRQVSESPAALLPLMVAHSNLLEWPAVLSLAADDRRDALGPAEKQLFDVLLFRAAHEVDPDFDLETRARRLLEAWPDGVAAHIAVAEVYRVARPDDAGAIAAKTKGLISDETTYSDRVMFAQLSVFREAWDDVIEVLDGHVPVDRPSEPLGWLALAFANAGTRSTTAPFYQSLGAEVIALPQFARLAGAAEHNRGDLKAAERYLRTAVEADPTDLRAILLLASALHRDNRESDAIDLLRLADDDAVQGSPQDLMRLAHNHRRAGDVERALRLGYRVAAANRQNEDVMSSYPGLVFLDEALPPPIGLPGPAQPGFWFDLEGLDGTRDVAGVINEERIEGVETFSSDHPLAVQLNGKSQGDLISMPAEFGPDRNYRVRELKHKYIWLLHDIMATHAARFPDATSMFEMTMRDGDVQPVLDMVREFQRKDDVVASTYMDFPVPLSAVAVMAHKPVLALAEHLATTRTNLRTCVGTHDEREEAARFVSQARGKGIVLDTLTVWQLRALGHLAGAKAYFGRLCISRSTFDELLELRAKTELNRGREYMTLGFDGAQAWRRVHTPEDTEALLEMINNVITEIEANCDILPADDSGDTRLEELVGAFSARQIFDPITIARSEGLIIVSEDLNLRQWAAQQNVIGGAWLQVVLHVMAADGALAERDYLIAVGVLGAMRHDHLWLDASTMIGILTLDDERAFALYEAALEFMGGRKADMPSHLGVTLDFMRRIWRTELPDWQKARAIGRLLTQLGRSRPDDWRTVLHLLDADLGQRANRGDGLAQRAHNYLVGWIVGHFYDLNDIRSLSKAAADATPRARHSKSGKRGARRGSRRPRSQQ